MLEALISEFAQIEDPRCTWRVEHKLIDILVIAVCAVLGEAESFEDIALYGRGKQDWLQRFLELPGGIPSHDTFRRVLMLIDPDRFERCFLDWVRSVFRQDAAAPRRLPPWRPGKGRDNSPAKFHPTSPTGRQSRRSGRYGKCQPEPACLSSRPKLAACASQRGLPTPSANVSAGEIHPHVVVLSVARVAGELMGALAAASGHDLEEVLRDSSAIVHQAARNHYEELQAIKAELMPVAGNA